VSARAFAVTLGVLAIVGLLAYGVFTEGGSNLAEGDEAPEATLPTLDGSATESLAEYEGKWVFVNFWASWCDPCREESPALQGFHEEHESDAFTVLGINQRDLTDDAEAFIAEYDLTYPQLRDAEGELADPFGMSGLPESFLIDPSGNVALVRRGPVNAEYLDKYVAPLITAATVEEDTSA
jgi:cytochrome c biogenesis protein CcmG, thiol:disulfide interchange protein DsbE